MPKTVNGLWPHVVGWDNLVAAYHAARKGKRYKLEVLEFGLRWEEALIDIHNRLVWDMWEPAPFRPFPVFEPKYRMIEAPPFPDRVVHHALHRVVQPHFERRFIHDSFACRHGGGIHAAAARLQKHLRAAQGRWNRVYVLQADISKYFPSIRHERLKRQIARTIRDRRVLALWSKIIDAQGEDGTGLPIGALTSQLGANVYLDALDHEVKNQLGEPFYLRYMDDWILLGPSKAHLWQRLDQLRLWLDVELGLRLSRAHVYPASQGVDWAGYRTWTTHILPRKRNLRAARRRFRKLAKQYNRGEIGLDEIRASTASFAGYTKHCAGWRSAKGLMQDLSDAIRTPSGPARRL